MRCFDSDGVSKFREKYREARKTLKVSISRTKEVKKKVMLEGLDRDTWACLHLTPYKVIYDS